MTESRFLNSPSAEPKRALAGADKQYVLQMWAAEKQKPDFDFEEFCETNARLLDVSTASIRRAINQQKAAFEAHIRTAVRTQAQSVAEAMGADVYAAMEALRAGLHANKERLIVDKETGIPIKDPNTGQFMFTSSADHQVRVRAASEILKIWGGYAPKQVEVSGEVQHTFHNKSREELQAELAKTLADIHRSGLTIDVMPQADPNMLEGNTE